MGATRQRTSPDSVKVAQLLFFINAVIWLLLGIFSLARITGNPGQSLTTAAVAVLMFGNVGAMLVAGIFLGRQNRWLYYFGIAVLLVNILLTVTDEFGLFDFITLVIDVILLGFLIVTRSRYAAHR